MGVLKRYTRIVDGSIPAPALLYEDEELLASQEGIGIYDGSQKSPHHQSGTIHITTHRLFYIDAPHPESRSLALALSYVSRTEYYAGLFTSSPKVTLHLHPIAAPAESASSGTSGRISGDGAEGFESWECEVCSHKNPPGLSPAASSVCALCGVPRASIKPSFLPSSSPKPSKPKSSTTLTSQFLSTSLPSSSANLLAPSSSVSPSPPPGGGADDEVRGENGEVPCPACTFFNHPSMAECELCGTALPKHRNSNTTVRHPTSKSAPPSRPVSPYPDGNIDDGSDDDSYDNNAVRMIRLSFRKGGDKAFYAVMRRSLLSKGWETKSGRRDGPSTLSTTRGIVGTSQSGINGLLRTVETSVATTQNSMEDAFQDLEALMVKAKDMVRLAGDLNERLTALTAASSASTPAPSTPSLPAGTPNVATVVEPEEATFIRSSLSQLGLQMTNAPVTLDMIRDERKWVEELTRELAGVLQSGKGVSGTLKGPVSFDPRADRDGGLMGRRGIVGLDEIWGGWNRARGVALIPPSTLLQVVPLLPTYTSPPVHMRTFPSSGLSVLHTPPYSKAAFVARLTGSILLGGPKTTVEVAQDEQLPIGLIQDMIHEAEGTGEICRDEVIPGASSALGTSATTTTTGSGRDNVVVASFGGQEVSWWANTFRGYIWDGQPD